MAFHIEPYLIFCLITSSFVLYQLQYILLCYANNACRHLCNATKDSSPLYINIANLTKLVASNCVIAHSRKFNPILLKAISFHSRIPQLAVLPVHILLVVFVITCRLLSLLHQFQTILFMQLFILCLCWVPVLSFPKPGLKSLAHLQKM